MTALAYVSRSAHICALLETRTVAQDLHYRTKVSVGARRRAGTVDGSHSMMVLRALVIFAIYFMRIVWHFFNFFFFNFNFQQE